MKDDLGMLQKVVSYPSTRQLTSEEQDLLWKFRFYLSTQKEVRHVPVLFGPVVEIQVLFVHTERGEACSSLVWACCGNSGFVCPHR